MLVTLGEGGGVYLSLKLKFSNNNECIGEFQWDFHQLVYTSYVGLLPIPTDTTFYNYRLILMHVRVTGNL